MIKYFRIVENMNDFIFKLYIYLLKQKLSFLIHKKTFNLFKLCIKYSFDRYV